MSKIVQLGGCILDLPDIFNLPAKGVISLVNSIAKESKKTGAKKLNKDVFVDARLRIISQKIEKKISSITSSGISLTDIEMKVIIKVIKSLENRGILLKGTTVKITGQEEGFLNFLRPLMTAGLPLMKSVLTPLVKSVLIP